MSDRYPKRLIEVDLPIKRISAHARREKSIRHGHICTLLTMTDVICDPLRRVESIEFRSVATETYFGLAGLTLRETIVE